jgi:hypothetical protein
VFEKFGPAAIEDGQFAGGGANGDRLLIRARDAQRRMLVVDAAMQAERVAGAELAGGMGERLPGPRGAAIVAVVAANGISIDNATHRQWTL